MAELRGQAEVQGKEMKVHPLHLIFTAGLFYPRHCNSPGDTKGQDGASSPQQFRA